MSARKDREERRDERIAAESEVAASDRRHRALQLAAGAAFFAVIAVVVVVIVVGSGSGNGGDPTHIVEAGAVDALLAKSPQQRLTIGQADAPVHIYEYGDLQCPYCKAFSEEAIPAVIEGPVDAGKANITFRNMLIIGPDSLPAGAAAIAAGEQGRGWNYIETFYRNQGEENSVREEATKTTESARGKLGFEGTPSFAIEGPKTEGLELLGSLETTDQLEEAIARAD